MAQNAGNRTLDFKGIDAQQVVIAVHLLDFSVKQGEHNQNAEKNQRRQELDQDSWDPGDPAGAGGGFCYFGVS